MKRAPQRAIPSVDRLVQALGPTSLPRPAVVHEVRERLAALRKSGSTPAFDTLVQELRGAVEVRSRSRLQPVINATGILAHTNLGRSPLAPAAADAVSAIARGYSNLELDLESGSRGSRAAWLEHCLALVCEAPAATVVNNCAAALVLVLRHLAAGDRRDVVISRGELVQIGGGFRIPEILEASGASLREVGTTNRTTLDDYRGALGGGTGLILKVHRSNFVMEGFVASPSSAELACLAHEHQVAFVEDLGSGALVDTASFPPVEHEPQPQEILRAGADLVCFSGDKLLGGPQAGILAGRTELVAGLKREPLFRALRCDKLVFAALQTTVELYLHAAARKDHGPPGELPVLAMLATHVDDLRARAERLLAGLADLPLTIAVGEGHAEIGGGVCPRSMVPSIRLLLKPGSDSLEALARRLRLGIPPVLGCIADGRVQLDLRTVFPEQDEVLVRAIRAASATSPGSPIE